MTAKLVIVPENTAVCDKTLFFEPYCSWMCFFTVAFFPPVFLRPAFVCGQHIPCDLVIDLEEEH